MTVELRSEQIKALREMSDGCILAGDVGSGKSITACAYYYLRVCGGIPGGYVGLEPKLMANPMDVYVITTAKKRDSLEWEGEFVAFGVGPEPNENGVKLHVDAYNNISQYEHVDGAFFIFDEQRLVGNGAWVKAFLQIAKNNRWILLSATPGDTWTDYIPVFLAHGFYRNRTEFIREHVVFSRFSHYPKIDRYIGTGVLEQYRRKLLVDMPVTRHTTRHTKDVLVLYDKDKMDLVWKQRWNPYTDEPIKDAGELFRVAREVANEDVSRLGEIMRLLETHPKLIVFYNFNYELDILRTIGTTLNYPIAEWNGKKHQKIPDTDKWVYLVQYTAGAEGWNCIETDAMAFYSLNYSWRVTHQAKGRIDRINTPFFDLYYYILRSTAPIDVSIQKSITAKGVFNEKKAAKKLGFDDWTFKQDELEEKYGKAA